MTNLFVFFALFFLVVAKSESFSVLKETFHGILSPSSLVRYKIVMIM